MKTWKQFMAGMFSVLLIAAMAGTALAAGGRLQAGSAGVVVLDKMKVEPGGTYTVGRQRQDLPLPAGGNVHRLSRHLEQVE